MRRVAVVAQDNVLLSLISSKIDAVVEHSCHRLFCIAELLSFLFSRYMAVTKHVLSVGIQTEAVDVVSLVLEERVVLGAARVLTFKSYKEFFF